MKKIKLAEHKYTRILTIISLKASAWNLDPEDSAGSASILSDILALIEHELVLLDSEFTPEERVKISPIIYNTSSHPGGLFYDLAEIIEADRTNQLV